jgi:hypothetical protein
MSIVFIMSSIIFGYSLKTYKANLHINESKKAKHMAESGFNESLLVLLDRLDATSIIESFDFSDSQPFSEDTNYSYKTEVTGNGFYNSSDFQVLGNIQSLVIKKENLTGEEIEYDSLAIETKGRYKESEYTF